MKMYRPHRLCPRNSKPKEPSLYRSLCVSILCMFLSTVMLVGTTMAWFSDSLQTGVYTITSANFSTTVSYRTELSSEANTPNNWQRLNPSNTTLFGGGSLCSGGSQVAYLKLVNNSNIPLKYTFTLTASGESGNIGDLSLAGCQTKTENGESFALIESDLKAIDLSAITPGSDSKTVVFDVPAAPDSNNPVIVYAVLKLTYTSSNGATSNIYNFSLKLAITQTDPNAQATDPPINSTRMDMTITGSTPSTSDTTTSDPANSSDKVTQQPADENNSGTNNTETSTGSTTGTSESGDTDTTGTTSDTSGGNGDTTVTENGSET